MKSLVLSGGGGKIAYTSATLKYIIGELGVQHQIYCGVSAGAICAAFLAQFPDGNEAEGAIKLYELCSKLDISKIYTRWKPFGRFHVILGKTSFYDSSPLNDLIRKNISLDKIRKSGKIVTAGTVSLTTGKYHVFDQSSDYFLEAVIASASFPAAFAPVKFLDQLWTDGGGKCITPLKTAIDYGATEIDAIVTSPATRIKKFIEKPNVIDIIKRVMDLSTDKIMSNDIDKLEMYNALAKAGISDRKLINFKLIRPDFNLTNDLLDFNPDKIQEMMDIGYRDAKNKYLIHQ